MAVQGGQLLWNRMQISLTAGVVDFDVDTVLQQALLGFDDGEPVLSGVEPVLPNNLGVASRVMVEPMAPFDNWSGITHQEPFVDPVTNTVHVLFSNPGAEVVINVLFWDPHTLVGPGMAHTYQNADVGPR
jgi:hypothetical protein